MDIRQGSQAFVKVIMVYSSSGDGITGLTYADVSVLLAKNGGGLAAKTMTAQDWIELSDTQLPGVYWLRLTASDTNTLGTLAAFVTFAGAETYPVPDIAIVTKKAADAISDINTNTNNAAVALMQEVRLAQGQVFSRTTFTFDGDGKQTAAVREVYDTEANRDLHDGVTGLLWKKTLTLNYDGQLVDERLEDTE